MRMPAHIVAFVLGPEFPEVMRAAARGEETAFVRLWRDNQLVLASGGRAACSARFGARARRVQAIAIGIAAAVVLAFSGAVAADALPASIQETGTQDVRCPRAATFRPAAESDTSFRRAGTRGQPRESPRQGESPREENPREE